MKRYLLITLFAVSTVFSFAQESSNQLSIGFGTGINSYTGMIGANVNLRVHESLSAQGALGLGGWGWKTSIGIVYHRTVEPGWSFGLGYSRCSGGNNVEQELELDTKVKEKVVLDMAPAHVLNIKATRSWRIGADNTFYLDLGYSILMNNNLWTVHDNKQLSDDSEAVMNLSQPGGLMLGLGFTFGL